MTGEEIAVTIAEHGKEIGSLKHRMRDMEELNGSIQSLVLSVQQLASNMENMCKEQERQAQRICMLEEKPARRWDTLVTAIITALASGFIGYMISNIF